jgi:hypothetical protein
VPLVSASSVPQIHDGEYDKVVEAEKEPDIKPAVLIAVLALLVAVFAFLIYRLVRAAMFGWALFNAGFAGARMLLRLN